MNTEIEICGHLQEVGDIKKTAEKQECQECVKTGDNWIHLRVCQTCGGVHCCDASKNKHAEEHFHQTHHPVISSAQPGEEWLYCYKDNSFTGY